MTAIVPLEYEVRDGDLVARLHRETRTAFAVDAVPTDYFVVDAVSGCWGVLAKEHTDRYPAADVLDLRAYFPIGDDEAAALTRATRYAEDMIGLVRHHQATLASLNDLNAMRVAAARSINRGIAYEDLPL